MKRWLIKKVSTFCEKLNLPFIALPVAILKKCKTSHKSRVYFNIIYFI